LFKLFMAHCEFFFFLKSRVSSSSHVAAVLACIYLYLPKEIVCNHGFSLLLW
jgi:hypothetical protein